MSTYYAPDGTLMNANGTRSIFDDTDADPITGRTSAQDAAAKRPSGAGFPHLPSGYQIDHDKNGYAYSTGNAVEPVTYYPTRQAAIAAAWCAFSEELQEQIGALNEWKAAIDTELVTIGSTADSFATPKAAIAALLDWHVKVATDPAVGGSDRRSGYAGVIVWIGDRESSKIINDVTWETSRFDELSQAFARARAEVLGRRDPLEQPLFPLMDIRATPEEDEEFDRIERNSK